MELKFFITVFVTVFLAEIGDKTQLATMLFASDKDISKWLVFLASASALVICAGLGVLAGAGLSGWINQRAMSIIAGGGFILIGCILIYQACSVAKQSPL